MRIVSILILGALGCATPSRPGDEATTEQAVVMPPMYSSAVTPINWSLFPNPLPSSADAIVIRDILRNTNTYTMSTYWTTRGFDAQPWHMDLNGSDEGHIRSAASAALAMAVSLRFGLYVPGNPPYDVSEAVARQRTHKLIATLAYRHEVNWSNGWGYDWQTPLWALYAGTAGWLLWDELDSTDQEYVRKMVEAEGRRLVGYDSLYYRYPSGSINYPGDSKAEEDAWNAQFLYLAVNMMPNHPLRKAWEFTSAELAASSHAMPADVSSTTVVGGKPLKFWLYGSNVNADGAVVNHYMVHPDYMATAAYTASAPIWYGLRRQPTPTTSFVRIPSVYDALIELPWSTGQLYPDTFCVGESACICDAVSRCVVSSPGTIYKPNTYEISYPHRTDWGTGRMMNFVFMDVTARAFGLDSLVPTSSKANVWEALHAQRALAMQNQYPWDGRTYHTADEDTYPDGREEWVAAHAALSYLTKWIVAQKAFSTTNAQIDIALDDQDREYTRPLGAWTTDEPAANDQFAFHNQYAPASGSASSPATRRARWQPNYLPAGNYRVSAWWSAFPNHSTAAPYFIARVGGTTRVNVNQQINGGHWNVLGTFQFDGTANTGFVELTNQTTTGYVVADGVQFERLYDDVLAPP